MGEQQWLSFFRIGKWLLMTAIIYLIVRMKDVWWPVIDFIATVLTPFLLASFYYVFALPACGIHPSQRNAARPCHFVDLFVVFRFWWATACTAACRYSSPSCVNWMNSCRL
ncbi:hypothetical protein LR69_00302 [Geobacillus sp. BCO2]|nr:hypothetical protein LR69_00302 [Geobacillus sp. BCO2]